MNNVVVPNIKISGIDISFADLRSAEICEEINTASTFSIVVTAKDMEKGDLKNTNFALGTEVKIAMGLDITQPIISGEITSLESNFDHLLSTVEIRGYDRLHRLGLETKTCTYTNIKDSDVASQIAGYWSLSADAKNTGIVYPYLCQYNQNDLQFLLSRARRIRYEIKVENKTLFFQPSNEKDFPSLILEYMIDFTKFSAKLDTCYKGAEIKVRGWDVKKKKVISAKASMGDEVSRMGAKKTGNQLTQSAFRKSGDSIIHEPLQDIQEAEKLAKARFNAKVVESVLGQGIAKGNPNIRAGKTIILNGIGLYSGIYYITATCHSYSSTGYTTSFWVRRMGI